MCLGEGEGVKVEDGRDDLIRDGSPTLHERTKTVQGGCDDEGLAVTQSDTFEIGHKSDIPAVVLNDK